MTGRGTVAAVIAALCACICAPASAQTFQESELRNNVKQQERFREEHGTPAYQAELREKGTLSELELAEIAANDTERVPFGNLCVQHMDGCAGDVRYYNWAADGYGMRVPVLWTARNGATISGHAWATRKGPAKRPLAVITTGSVQAPEQLYWGIAASLAKSGYVVITWDVQGQGRSDSMGAAPAGDTYGAFVEGTEDAIDFGLSSAASQYVPRPSLPSGTSFADKQARRVAEERNAAFNPFWELVDPTRVGIAGNSAGAFGVSQVSRRDTRVDAAVGWDNIRTDTDNPPRVPLLGISNDYLLFQNQPYLTQPADDQARNEASVEYSKQRVDTGQLNIRGGTHFESAYIPNPAFPATFRGMDMVIWYTTAWFDKYVKGGDPTADARLLTTRWRNDAGEAAVDTNTPPDGNKFSKYFKSRLDIDISGQRKRCENLRDLAPTNRTDLGTNVPPETCGAFAADGEPPDFSYRKLTDTADPAGPGAGGAPNTSVTGTTAASAASPFLCGRRVALTSIRRGRRRVRLNGVADPRLAGLRIAIRAGGKVVGLVRIRPSGRFSVSVKPPKGATGRTLYSARIPGVARTQALRATQRLLLLSKRVGSRVVLKGAVAGAGRGALVTIQRRTACGSPFKTLTSVRTGRRGRFSVRIPAARGSLVRAVAGRSRSLATAGG